MNKLTDVEIVKWWEDEIHLAEYVDSDYRDGIKVDYIKLTLDLINRQKAEVERLQKIIVGFMDEVGTWSNKYDVDISNIYKLPILAKEDFNIRNKIKSEAIKEFWEKLKQKFQSVKYIPPSVYLMGNIILKEMDKKIK